MSPFLLFAENKVLTPEAGRGPKEAKALPQEEGVPAVCAVLTHKSYSEYMIVEAIEQLSPFRSLIDKFGENW
jgi:hypothetical protein